MGLILLFDQLEFVQKSLVADAQDLGSLTAIPAGLGENPFDGLALGLHGGAPADFEERQHLPVPFPLTGSGGGAGVAAFVSPKLLIEETMGL